MFIYDFLIKVSAIGRWIIFFCIWSIALIFWYLFIFNYFQNLTYNSNILMRDSEIIMQKLESNLNKNDLIILHIQEQDINVLNSLIIDLVQKFKLILGKCNISEESTSCGQCLCFCVKADFQNIIDFLNSIENLNLFKFCYCNLKLDSESKLILEFAVKQFVGDVVLNKKNTDNSNITRNPFFKIFTIQCLGVGSGCSNNNNSCFLIVKSNNKITKLFLGDIVDEHELISLNSEYAIFKNIKNKQVNKIILDKKPSNLKIS